jgi:hypothetical protein
MELLINRLLMLQLFEEVVNEKFLVLMMMMKGFDQDYFLMYNDEYDVLVQNDDQIEVREYNQQMMMMMMMMK